MNSLYASSGLRDSQALSELKLALVTAAVGVKWSINAEQSAAQGKVAVLEGNDASALSAAEAALLVKPESGTPSAGDSAIAAALDAALFPADHICVVIGGLRGLGEVASLEIQWVPAAGGAISGCSKFGPVTKLASSAAVPVASGSLSWYQEAGVLVAIIPAAEVPLAGELAKLVLSSKQ
jgi:hypothetical protein